MASVDVRYLTFLLYQISGDYGILLFCCGVQDLQCSFQNFLQKDAVHFAFSWPSFMNCVLYIFSKTWMYWKSSLAAIFVDTFLII
jgi:hypothetical protein